MILVMLLIGTLIGTSEKGRDFSESHAHVFVFCVAMEMTSYVTVMSWFVSKVDRSSARCSGADAKVLIQLV